MDGAGGDRSLIEAHLREILAWKGFVRAEKQARALELMVQASLDGAPLHGQDLALAIDGKTSAAFVKAVRQLVREIRSKLPRYYDENVITPVRFELEPNEYRIRFVFDESGVLPDRRRHKPRAGETMRPRVTIAFAVTLLALALATVAWIRNGVSRGEGLQLGTEALIVTDESGKLQKDAMDYLEYVAGFDFNRTGQLIDHVVRTAKLPGTPSGVLHWAFATYDPNRGDGTWLRIVDFDARAVIEEIQLPHFPERGPRPTLLYALDNDRTKMHFLLDTFSFIELDGDGLEDEILIVVTSHQGYPSQVLGIDFEDGPRVLLDYWNMGNVQAIAVPDHDGNGADEIVVYGQSTDDQSSAVAILEPSPGEILRGRAPNGRRGKTLRIVEDYPIIGLTIRLPQTDLAQIDRRQVLLPVSDNYSCRSVFGVGLGR